MKKRAICMTKYDVERLENLLAAAEANPQNRNRQDLKDLREELSRARILEPADMPPTVVTMNSRVRLRDADTDEVMEYTLVFPDDADFDLGRISIMSSVGTAILGYSVGDTVAWTMPGGRRRLKIEALPYQPEKAGDWHL